MTDFARVARFQPWRPRPATQAAPPADRPFPDLLRGHRVRSGLTQRALADLSTISSRAIRDLEAGRANARTQTLHLLADALRLNGLHRDLFVHVGLSGRDGAGTDTDAHRAVPRPVNALLGRDAEVPAMVEVLESGRRRMISISGLPGVGKSRLAAEIAARLRAERGWPVLWFGAQTWVAGEPATPYEPLMRALRVLIESPGPDVAPVAKLLGRHEALLILDGVADTRPPHGVAELLAYCPGVRLISTSRAPWHVPGVRAAVVPPLATPDVAGEPAETVETLARVPSVRLLIDRVAEIRPGFVLTPTNASAAAELCRRLDGLPLAIELLATRTRVLSLQQLAEIPPSALLDLVVPAGADGVPETIGGLIASVYERIDGEQQAIVRQLARTHGPWTAAGVAAALERPLDEVVDALSVLIGHGVISASYGEPATDLHIPNLLCAVLRRKGASDVEASMQVSSQPTFVGLNTRRSSPHARHATDPVAPTIRGGKGMATNSADALRRAGIIGGAMSPELEEFYGSLTKEETDVLISTRNRLAAILPDVEAHAQGWSTPEATGQDFDAAMLCACGLWSGSGSSK